MSHRPDQTTYVRTQPAAMGNMKDLISQQIKPSTIYAQASAQDTENLNEIPRDVKQLRNIKYRMEKESRGDAANQNFADQVLQITSMVSANDNFVRCVVHDSNKVPSILLYTDKTMDIARYTCCTINRPSVLGVDRTFNMCDLFVTATSFKHPGLLRKSSGENPILVGPIMLHGSATHEVYGNMFAKIANRFGESGVTNLVIGSDDEFALRRAIRDNMPQADNILCTRHLKKNVDEYLQNTIGLNESDRHKVQDSIFGVDGAVSADDTVSYEEKLSEVKSVAQRLSGSNGFDKYVEGRLSNLLKTGIVDPARRHNVQRNWTNNNSESVNHILKSVINWKALPLPSLIEALRSVIITQEKDIERALLGMGNFKLSPNMLQYRVATTDWAVMNDAAKQRKFWDFVCDRKAAKNIVSSSDGKLNVLKTPSGGKKPGQRKRKKAERATSVKKKKPTTDMN